MNEWLKFLKDYVGKPDKDAYFVAHSLGCITIARYLEALPIKARVGGCVFVAGFSGRLNIPEISEFYSLPFDAEKAKIHCDKFTMVFSDNDPFVIPKNQESWKNLIGAKIIVEHHKGHFSGNDGIIELPSALESVLEISNN